MELLTRNNFEDWMQKLMERDSRLSVLIFLLFLIVTYYPVLQMCMCI